MNIIFLSISFVANTFFLSSSIHTQLLSNQIENMYKNEKVFMPKTLLGVDDSQRNKRGHLWEMKDEFEDKNLNFRQEYVQKALAETSFVQKFWNKLWGKSKLNLARNKFEPVIKIFNKSKLSNM
jgi:hypothetical protein